MLPYYTIVATLILVTLIPVSVTFSFQIIEAHVCGKLSLKWQGGRKPYSFLVMPIHNAPDESKPDRVLISQQIDSVYTNNYTMPNFPFSRDAQFVVIMSDADGFGKSLLYLNYINVDIFQKELAGLAHYKALLKAMDLDVSIVDH